MDRKINIGGMYRCCVETLQQKATPDVEGEEVICPHCKDELVMVNGAWNWLQPKEAQRRKERRQKKLLRKDTEGALEKAFRVFGPYVEGEGRMSVCTDDIRKMRPADPESFSIIGFFSKPCHVPFPGRHTAHHETVCLIQDQYQRCYAGRAFCSTKDRVDLKRGRNLALLRARKGLTFILQQESGK